MVQNRKSSVLLFLILLFILAIPTGLALASRPNDTSNVASAQTTFNKLSPTNGFSTHDTSIQIMWSSSIGILNYQFCYDTINNNICDTTWNSAPTSTTQVTIGTLTTGNTYYWQVRAIGPTSMLEANNGTWWSLTVLSLPTRTFTPGPFAKFNPVDGAINQSTTLFTSWSSSPNAVRYEYCYDTSNNDSCDNVNGWVSTGTWRSVSYTNLAYSTKYYWQVRAVDASNNIVYPNNSTWWSFTVMPIPLTPTRTRTPTITPNPVFFKTGPSNNAIITSSNVVLSWSASTGVVQYQYCYDTTNNNNCDTTWISTNFNQQASTNTLLPNTTYYWQVRAIGASGSLTEANGNGSPWWRFTKQ
jgi:hypothetical protein